MNPDADGDSVDETEGEHRKCAFRPSDVRSATWEKRQHPPNFHHQSRRTCQAYYPGSSITHPHYSPVRDFTLRIVVAGPNPIVILPRLEPSMKPAREYRARSSVCAFLDANTPIGFASRLWIDLTLGDIRHRINEISEQFTGAGWKNLPQELVDEILGYLLGDLNALKASSLTCKHLFGATRPLIHQRLVCSGSTSTPDPTNPKGFLFSRRQRVPGVFERLIEADRSGVLRYTRHLTIKVEDGHLNQRDVEHLPHLRSIIRLHGLTLDNFHLPPFIPVFNEHFGMFTDTVRRLDIRSACGTELQLSYIICQFPLLEDLTIMSPAEDATKHGIHVPVITQSPPLRGTLVLVRTRARELYEGLAAFPSGLNFRSLELYKCGEPLAVFAACGRTVTSISYLWLWGDVDSESNTSHQVHIVI